MFWGALWVGLIKAFKIDNIGYLEVHLRDWGLRWDMNYDGVFTISDVWAILHSLFFYPGDLIVYIILNTKVGIFLEFSTSNYGGFFSGIISFLAWWICIIIAFFILLSELE